MLLKSDQSAIVLRQWFSMLFTRGRLVLILAALGTAAAAGVDSEQKLEAAIHQEIVLGDLKGAMGQYQSVIRESASKPAVARALYRYARCLEKLERRREAFDVYTRIVQGLQRPAGSSADSLAAGRLGIFRLW